MKQNLHLRWLFIAVIAIAVFVMYPFFIGRSSANCKAIVRLAKPLRNVVEHAHEARLIDAANARTHKQRNRYLKIAADYKKDRDQIHRIETRNC